MEARKGAQQRPQRPPRPNGNGRTRRPRKSYSIGEVLCTIVAIAGLLSLLWGYAIMYQIGYDKGATYTERVMLNG